MPDRIRALYVDDEPGLLEVARLFLEQSPEFSVVTMESAKKALASPDITSCDAIISDYQMPSMDGIGFLKAVREKYGDIPFILFTGRGREEVVIEAINNGADFYLQKGGDPTAQFAELAHKIRQAVSRRKAQQELMAAYEQITASEEELRDQYEELARGERRVRESQERYGSIIENSPYGMHFYDLDPARGLVFTGANPAADRILGIRHEPLVGKTLLEAFPGLAGTEIPDRYRQVTESGTPWQTEQVIYDKGEIHGAFAVTAFRPAQGSMAALFVDITDRKKAEMDRQESEERLRNFMDSATDAFAIWDARLNLVDMNRVALSYLPEGTRKEDIIGRNLREFLSGEGEWGSIERYHEILKTGVPLSGTEKVTESSAGTRWLSVKCFRVGDGLGIMTTDVTREKIAEERLREAYDKLTTSEEELTQQYGELSSAQDALQESRQQMAEIADTVPGVVFQSRFSPGEKEKFTFISSHGPEVFGISTDPDGFSERFYAQVDASDREQLARSISHAVKNELPWEYEGRFTKPSGEKMWFQGLARPVRKASGLYFTGVLLDITSRKRAEEELRAGEERLRLLIQQAPVSIAMFDTEMRYLTASRRWLADASLSDHDIAGRSHYEIFPHLPDDIKDAHRRALAGEVVSSSEYRYVHGDGTVQWFTWEVRPWFVKGDTIGGILLFSEDITGRKTTEDALREKTEELDQFFTASLDLFCIAGTDGTFHRLNPEWERTLGYSLAELEGHRFLDFVHPDDLPATLAAVADLSSEKTVLNFVNRYRHKDGSYRWIEWRSLPKGDLIFAAARDITGRRETETALHESEKRYHDLFERTKAVMLIVDRETSNIVDANAAACRYYGYTLDEFRGLPIGAINMLDATNLHREMDRAASHDGLVFRFQHRKKNGEIRDVEVFSAPVTIGGRELLHSIVQDITERIRAEEALRTSEERLGLFIQQAPVSMAMFDTEMRYLAASRRWMGDYNLGDRDIAGRSHYEIFPEISEDIRAIHRRGLAGEVISSAEDRFVRSNGSVQWLAWEVRPWYTTGNAIGGIIIYSEDITRQKLVEEELREKTHEIENYFSASIDLFCIADKEGKFLLLNPEWDRVLGYPVEELVGRTFGEFVHPDDLPSTLTIDQEMLGSNEARDHTNRIRHKDGTYRWIEWRAVPAADRVYAAGRDITERKRAEEALRESEEKYRSLVESATEAIFIIRDRHMIYANPRMAELLGVAEENLLDHSFLDFVWPADRALVLDRYTRRMAGEDIPTHYDFRMTGPEGKLLWVHISIAKVTWQQKPATLNLLTDITERKRAETALQEAWRKLALLNSVTRHDIRNQLITLQGFTQYAKKKEQDPAIAGYLEKIDSCAGMIRGQIEFMKTYHELGVNAPSWHPLDEVVKKACIKELPCRNLCSGTEIFADPMLGKVFFNLFDNAHRHGEHATEVVVRCETGGEDLTIIVEDNGIGIPDDEKEKVFEKGYGKNTGFGLFLAREIISITGIAIRETGAPGKGARFEILVPRECWRKSGA